VSLSRVQAYEISLGAKESGLGKRKQVNRTKAVGLKEENGRGLLRRVFLKLPLAVL
jgi:hypothetical protein